MNLQRQVKNSNYSKLAYSRVQDPPDYRQCACFLTNTICMNINKNAKKIWRIGARSYSKRTQPQLHLAVTNVPSRLATKRKQITCLNQKGEEKRTSIVMAHADTGSHMGTLIEGV